MEVAYLTNQTLSRKALELVDFDVDSIRQAVTGRHASQPLIWLADPGQYEREGRVLRDSSSSRLLAYSDQDRILYTNDGCNSCVHSLPAALTSMTTDQLRTLAINSNIPPELLEKIAHLAITGS